MIVKVDKKTFMCLLASLFNNRIILVIFATIS